ncbi:A1pp-domain-containing protein [Armillaria novae-zelandiae]|uniref:A1pp-domain-containing protein n=1 Tax=Armillaria novae-zelandiae TaxID=153914 RepID=A0AA39UCB0_9AGAR|nr:A1pp-domain-containing protein [Armillaria novae-zelandiae]
MSRPPSPSDGSDTDAEDMPIVLERIPTLAQLFKQAVIKAVEKPKYPIDSTLLDRISLFQGDITKLSVDSIVNAANKSLLGGGGVDGAIHAAAGRGLLEECRGLNGCETGQSKITKGYKLPSTHVIHTVGPIYSSKDRETKAEQLASCYRTSLELAVKNSLKHIAFPSISTGIYGYPIEDATHVALQEVRQFVTTESGSTLERVIFVVWSNKDRDVYQELLPEYFPHSGSSEPKEEE